MSPWISARFLQAQSDERLLAAARQGHERAFEMLVRRHRASLLGYARRLLPDGSAEDALQQGLLRGWAALQRGGEVQNVRAWLFQVVHNTAVDMLRSVRPQHGLEESLPGAAGVEAAAELRLAVRETLAAVAALPDVQREALLRTAVDGDSHECVASTLGVSADAVRGLVYRARATLRAAATALTPPPLVAWASTAERGGTPLLQRLAGIGANGSGEALVKYGAAALAAAGAAAGAAVVHHGLARHPPASRAPAPRLVQAGSSLPGSSQAAAAVDLASAQVHATLTSASGGRPRVSAGAHPPVGVGQAPTSRAPAAHGLIGRSREAPSQSPDGRSIAKRAPGDGSGSDGLGGGGDAGLGAEGKDGAKTAGQEGSSGGDGSSGGSTSDGSGGAGGEQHGDAETSGSGSGSLTSSGVDGSGGGSGSDGSGSGVDGGGSGSAGVSGFDSGVSGSNGSDASQPNGGQEPTA